MAIDPYAEFRELLESFSDRRTASYRLKADWSHLLRIARKERRPGLPLAVRIEVYSGGRIRPADWLTPDERAEPLEAAA